jgi:hypothetical protein
MRNLIEYFIKRSNLLPDMGREIEYLIISEDAGRELGLPSGKNGKILFPDWTEFRGFDVHPIITRIPVLGVQIRGEHIIEDWYADFRADPEPNWMPIIKNYQRMQARRRARALFEVPTREKEPT